MQKNKFFFIEDFLPYILTQAAETVSANFQAFYKGKYGILRTEWRVLFHLGNFGQMTARDIGINAKTHKTKISRAVFRLEKKKYLKRTTSEEDRRVEFLSLTEKGVSVYNDLKKEAEGFEKRITKNFTESEVLVLRQCLKKLEANFD